MPTTTNYSFVTPTIDASENTWGTLNNQCWTDVDSELFRVEGLIPATSDFATKSTANTFAGNITAPTFVGALTGNASTATRWANNRVIFLTGIVTNSGTEINGDANTTINTSIADAALSIAKTSGLQTALDAKEPTLDASRKRIITYGTAAVGGTLAEGDIYLQHEA